MIEKSSKTPQNCIISGKPISTFGGKKDREANGIHTDFGPVHRENYPEYEKITREINSCVRDVLNIGNISAMPQKASRLVPEIGKFCAKKRIEPKEAMPFFTDQLNKIKGK